MNYKETRLAHHILTYINVLLNNNNNINSMGYIEFELGGITVTAWPDKTVWVWDTETNKWLGYYIL
jgi:hypothetical protein